MSEKSIETDTKPQITEHNTAEVSNPSADPAKAESSGPEHSLDPHPASVSKEPHNSSAPTNPSAAKLLKPSTAELNATTSKSDPELEAYLKLRQSLKNSVKKKAKIDKDLEDLEEEISAREDTYLQESSAGNVAKGFDQYTKSSQNRRKSVITDQDRIFSQSSTSFEAEM